MASGIGSRGAAAHVYFASNVETDSSLSSNVTNVSTRFSGCEFSSCVATGGSYAMGGAVDVAYENAFGTSTSFHRCHFKNNIAGSSDRIALGGAIHSAFVGTTIDSSFTVSDSIFGSNGAGSGGGVHLEGGSSVTARVSQSRFENNTASRGAGGGLSIIAFVAMEIAIVGSHFTRNVALIQGAGLSAVQSTPNAPANLLLGYVPATQSSAYFPAVPALCYAEVNETWREYNYSSPPMLIASSAFEANRAQIVDVESTNTTAISSAGGGLYAINFRVILRDSNVTSNYAAITGGGIQIGPGSGTFTVNGNSIISGNSATVSGSGIYSTSTGAIVLEEEALLDISGSTAVPGVSILSGGNYSLGAQQSTVVQCGVGEQLEVDFTDVTQVNVDWQINCSYRVREPGTDEPNETSSNPFVNPGCAQIQSDSCTGLPVSPVMLEASGTISCVPCFEDTYNLSRGMLRAGVNISITCAACPFGAKCRVDDQSAGTGGGEVSSEIAVARNYWGHAVTVVDDAAVGLRTRAGMEPVGFEEAVFMNCPAQYCCTSTNDLERQGCPWNSDSACEMNRDPAVPLCGGCLPGYSHAISGNACIPNALCGAPAKVVQYAAELLLTWVCYCIFFMYQANAPSLVRWLPGILRPHPTAPNDGAISVLVFYYQMASLAVPGGTEKVAAQSAVWFCMLGEILDFGSGVPSWAQCTSENAEAEGVCIAVGTAAATPTVWALATPIVLIFLLYPTIALFNRIEQYTKSRRVGGTHRESSSDSVVADQIKEGSQPLLTGGNSTMSSINDVNRFNVEQFGEDSDGSRSNSSFMTASGGRSSSLTPYQAMSTDLHVDSSAITSGSISTTALVYLILFCYKGFSDATFRLLHCVPVCRSLRVVGSNSDGLITQCVSEERVLFYAGGTTCDPLWQFPVYLLLVISFALPVSPVLLWLLRHHLPQAWHVCKWTSSLSHRHQFSASVQKTFYGPFKERYWHWMAVMVVQRLLLVSVNVFINMDIVVSLGMMVVSLWFLLFELLARPYKTEWVNTLQMITSTCLVGLTILNSPAGALTSVGFDAAGTPLEGILQDSEVLMFLLLVAPPLSFAALKGCELLRQRRMAGGVQEDRMLREGCVSNPVAGGTLDSAAGEEKENNEGNEGSGQQWKRELLELRRANTQLRMEKAEAECRENQAARREEEAEREKEAAYVENARLRSQLVAFAGRGLGR